MPYTYGQLCQTHPTYDAKLIETLDDLYTGGFQLMKRSDKYLTRAQNESPQRFRERVELATYQAYFGQIVDQFASDLFEQNLEVTPAADASNKATPGTDTVDSYYTDFAKNADGDGNALVDILRTTLTTGLVHQRGIVCIDAPPPGDSRPQSLAEEDNRGLRRFYVYPLPLECLVDWETDDDCELVWAIIRKATRKRATPSDKRNVTIETFTVWEMTDAGKAHWSKYQLSYDDAHKPELDDEVELVDEGDTSFDRIPVRFFDLPDGLWVGNKIGPATLEHYRRRSLLIGAEGRSLVSIPVAALGSEVGSPAGPMPSEAQQDPDRGDNPFGQFQARGFVVTGKDDKIYYAEPSGHCYELVDKQLKELRDDIFAVCHQMAASVRTNSTALGRSGLSKQSDQASTAKVLTALGRMVRQFAIEIYDCISVARGDKIMWSAHGLDNYQPRDREQILEESVSLDQVQIPSPTFRKLHKFQSARDLTPNATSQELDVIRDEINDGVDAEQEIRDLENEAKVDQIKNPPAPVVTAPNVKQPAPKQPSGPSEPRVGAVGGKGSA